MTEPGLNNRLRQHSRRSGLFVGITMALTIIVLIVGFVWIFRWFEPLIADFVDRGPVTPTAVAVAQANGDSSEPTAVPSQPANSGDAVQPTQQVITATTPTGDGTQFTPDYQITSPVAVNLRSGPSRDTEIVTQLSPGTELMYLNESEDSADPAQDGARWLRFRTVDGQEGWVREIDVDKL